MKRLYLSRPLFKTGLLALLTIPFLILINKFSPPADLAPNGYSSSILAFEFASNTTELEDVLRPLSKNEITDLDQLNYVDYGFMIIYGIFLFAFMGRFGEITKNDFLVKSKWIVPIIVIADILENIQLLKFTKLFLSVEENINGTFIWLSMFTYSKWLLLAVAFSIIGIRMTKMKLPSKLLGYPLLIPLLLGIIGIISKNPIVENLFATSVFFSFLLIFLYALIYKREL